MTVSNSPFVTAINEMLFTATAPAYSFAINSTFQITGTGIVNNSAFAPTLSINGGSSILFESTSTAGNAIINNNNTGTLTFDFNSTAGSATINNLSTLVFASFASAGNSTINQGPTGTLNFFDLATGGNATISNNGTVIFNDLTTGGQARLINNSAGAIVDFSSTNGLNDDGKVSAGSIEGLGTFFLGGNQLTVGGNNLSTTVSGIIADGGSGGVSAARWSRSAAAS